MRVSQIDEGMTVAEAWNTWVLPRVEADGSPPGSQAGATRLTAAGVEKIQAQAYEEGFAKGRRDGMAQFGKESRHRIAALDTILTSLTIPLEQVDDSLARQVAELAMTVARQLIRRELKTDPGEVVAAAREALSVFPAEAKDVRLHLNPDDVKLVNDALTLENQQISWRIIADPLISRGGCELRSDRAELDATVESRMSEVITRVLGGEREADL